MCYYRCSYFSHNFSMLKDTKSPEIDGTAKQDNIFDELSSNIDIKNEVEKQENRKDKWVFYYLKLGSSGLIVFNMLLFFFIILFSAYSYIQGTTTARNFSFLSPVCKVFISKFNENGSCYSVNYLLTQEKENLESLKEKQAFEIASIFWDLYSFENFHLSKKMVFLLERSANRLEPTKIILAFDELKNRYSSVDKSEISCNELEVSQDNILEMNCDVYSSDWDTKIVTFKDGIKTFKQWGGTSISKAVSFIDFLKNYEESPFRVLEQNNTFTSEEVQLPPYTQKTSIELSLEYNTFNIDN